MNMIRIGLIGDFSPDVKAHVAIPRALQLAGTALGCQVASEWIPTPLLESNVDEILGHYQALWVVPASPYASMQGALHGIQYAREHLVPLLGTCGGFQHLVIEFARNVLGLSEADHAETNPTAATLLVREIVLCFPDLVEAVRLLAAQKIALLGWEIWLLYSDGRCGHSGDSLDVPPMRGAHEAWQEFVHRSIQVCLDTAESNLPEFTENAKRRSAECYFCLSIATEDEL